MKRVVTFFDQPGFEDYPFSDPVYRRAYHELGALLSKLEIQLMLARGQQTYTGNNTFSCGWAFVADSNSFTEQTDSFVADLIYDKGHFIADKDARLVNDPALDTLCTDKWETYQHLGALLPATFIVKNKTGLQKALTNISGEMAAIKPLDGEEGKGVLIGQKKNIAPKASVFPCIVQEFLDSSAGIPGITKSRHDLRMVIVNGEVVYSYVRMPKKGAYIANVAQGGSFKVVEIGDLPSGALNILHTVEEYLSPLFPTRLYSLDVCRTTGDTWKIIELNSKPGITDSSESPGAERLLRRIAQLFADRLSEEK